MPRTYPEIAANIDRYNTPISFICVRFSDEFEHNIAKSQCIHDPLNEFVVVDNRQNLYFDTLGQAINHGVTQARNELIVIVHEDVFLIPGWQSRLEQSLHSLAAQDPDWGLAGAVGWKADGELVGHWSDPHLYCNTLAEHDFENIYRIDEQILIFRRSSPITLDPFLPGIHNIGEDLAHSTRANGLKTYVVNAPTIHKYADEHGRKILSLSDSPKIRNRESLTYQADFDCSMEYFEAKWSPPAIPPPTDASSVDPIDLDEPIVLLGRGGSGTRLLSEMAQDVGVFIGTNVSASGDCIDMAPAIYRAIVRKFNCPDERQRSNIVPDLRSAAAQMISARPQRGKWGFKLPETLLILPEIRAAFPNATYVRFSRDLADTVLRRSHMTARTDNHIGRIALKVAYDHFSLSRDKILTDESVRRMVITTLHQLDTIDDHRKVCDDDKWLDITYEQTISNPAEQLDRLSSFLGLRILTRNITHSVDRKRQTAERMAFDTDAIERTGVLAHPRAESRRRHAKSSAA
ncbi:MAG: sulfotransferase [Dokdonella sp.]